VKITYAAHRHAHERDPREHERFEAAGSGRSGGARPGGDGECRLSPQKRPLKSDLTRIVLAVSRLVLALIVVVVIELLERGDQLDEAALCCCSLVGNMSEISPALYRAGAGEPLLLLHGFTGAWNHWRPLLDELSVRYEVIAPALAGHDGGKPLPAGIALNFASSTDLLEEHLDELGLDTVHVVGNSMGGALALELAKRGRARSVVALAPAGGWSPGDGEALRLARFFARQLRLTRASASYMCSILTRPKLRRLVFRETMRHGELVSPSQGMELAESSLRCTVADLVLDALRSDRADLSLGDLGRIDCPVRLASPQFDRILPPERHALRYRREIPNVDAITLTGCGHVPMWDDTALVIRTITEFVDRHVVQRAPVTGLSSS
jgi:pimeloyl-ACP methyl ester carboxylesterase